MGDTNAGWATNDAATQKLWARKWWIAAKEDSYWYSQGFVGKDPERFPIQDRADLEKNKGDQITYGEWPQLSGSGVSGDSTMEGSEETWGDSTNNVTIDQYRNAVLMPGMMNEQRHADTTMRDSAKTVLAQWMAEHIDQKIFTTMATSLTKVIYGGDATSTADIDSSDYMELGLITKATTLAAKSSPFMMGVPVGGRRHFVCVMSPDQQFDISEQSSRWETAVKDAAVRGDSNPLFKSGSALWKNVILHQHGNVPVYTTWGSGGNQPGATALFFGVKAGVIAYAKRKIYAEKTFDYGNKWGVCMGAIYGVGKVTFNSADKAVIGIHTYRTNNT